MSIITRAKELINSFGKEETIIYFEKEIEKLGEPKSFEDMCKLSGFETAIKYIKEELEQEIENLIMENKKQQVQIINPTQDNYVYALTFTPSIYESAYATISLHKTIEGAEKAKGLFIEEQEREFIEIHGEEFAKTNEFDYACDYNIEKIEILD